MECGLVNGGFGGLLNQELKNDCEEAGWRCGQGALAFLLFGRVDQFDGTDCRREMRLAHVWTADRKDVVGIVEKLQR